MRAFHSRARRNAADPTPSNVDYNNSAASNGVVNHGVGSNGGTNNGAGKNGAGKNGARLALVAPPRRVTPAPLTLLPLVQEERIRKILETIETKPRCTMDDLAEEFKLSHSHLQHLVKEETGVGLGHILAEKRLSRAAELLESSNLSVKQIADTVGYEHASSFIRAFERRFTHPPRVYRLQNARPK